MESKNELKEIDIKNRACSYFEDIMRARDIDSGNILLEEKSHKTCENILIYDISYKIFMSSIPMHIRFDKIDVFIKIYDGIRHLEILGHSCPDEICDTIKYLISEKNGITDSINHSFARIRIDSCNSSPIEKILTFHNVIILIKSVVNKNKNEYYYNTFLEKGSYKDKSNTQYF